LKIRIIFGNAINNLTRNNYTIVIIRRNQIRTNSCIISVGNTENIKARSGRLRINLRCQNNKKIKKGVQKNKRKIKIFQLLVV